MKAMTIALVLAWFGTSAGVAQEIVIGPEFIVGIAGRDAGAVFGGFQMEGQVELQAFAASVAYRWVGIGRSCQTSLPPSCNVDTPGGHLFLLGASRVVAGGSGTRVRAGVEVGIGRFLNNAESARETRPVLGATAVQQSGRRTL